MKEIIISMAMGGISSNYVNEATAFCPPNDARGRKRRRKIAVAALAAALLAALAFTAYTKGFFTIQDMEVEHPEGWGYEAVDTSGYEGSPLYMANEEWDRYLEFCPWGENDPQPGAENDMYTGNGAYSEKARTRLDEILLKYGLKMPEYYEFYDGHKELCSQLGIGEIFPECPEKGINPVYAQYYQGGSLQLFDVAQMPNGESFGCQIFRYDREYFVRRISIVIQWDSMEQWSYVCADGTELLVGLGDNKSILAADLENSFVFVCLQTGRVNFDPEKGKDGTQTFDKAELEEFAELVDFALIDSISE